MMPQIVTSRPWTAEEDRLLMAAMSRRGGFESWKQVADLVPGRTNKACRKRWLHSLCPTIKKTTWTADEDRKLVELHATYGNKWSTIARFIEGRTDDACSKRFREALDPTLKKDTWTPEEDAKLLEIQKQYGCKWKEVGISMQRGSLACRNRFRLLERRGPNKDTTTNLNLSPSDSSLPLDYDISQEYYHDQPSVVQSTVTGAPFQYSSSSLLAAIQPLPQAVGYEDSMYHSTAQSTPVTSTSSLPSPTLVLGSLDPADSTFSAPSTSDQFFASSMDPQVSFFWDSFVNDFREENTDVLTSTSNTSDFSHPSDVVYSTPTSSPENTPFTQTMALYGSNDTPLTHDGGFPEDVPSEVGPLRRRRFAGRKRLTEQTKISAYKPVNAEIKGYACGHPVCWPSHVETSSACFSTAADLQEHNKVHAKDVHEEKPYRCALCGSDKKWKSINGLQYHLQVSPAHFQEALKPKVSIDPQEARKNGLFMCGRAGCAKLYKNSSGLHYHLKHGHRDKLPAQLSEVPHGVTHTLEERRRRRQVTVKPT